MPEVPRDPGGEIRARPAQLGYPCDSRGPRGDGFLVRPVHSGSAGLTREVRAMILRQTTVSACLAVAVSLTCATFAQAQAGAESFTATAAMKTAGGAEASAPVTITVDRKMSQAEADKLVAAFKSGGAAGLRK